MKKKIAIIFLAFSVLAGCTATPTFAHVDEGIEQEYVDYGEEVYWDDSYVPVDGYVEETVYEGPAVTEPVTGDVSTETPPPEDNPPLTPEGNLTLVDNVMTAAGTKQFLTLTSRAGNFYYLVIDYDKDGASNAHFLNQVDERDLISLMDEDEAKELEERITQKAEAEKAAEEAKKAQEEAAREAEMPPEPTPIPEKTVIIAGYEFSQKIVTAIFALIFVLIILLFAFFMLGKKKKAETSKPDPDADYDDEYGDEIYIPEGAADEGDYK